MSQNRIMTKQALSQIFLKMGKKKSLHVFLDCKLPGSCFIGTSRKGLQTKTPGLLGCPADLFPQNMGLQWEFWKEVSTWACLSVENVSWGTLTHSLLCLFFILIKLSVVPNKTEHEEGWCMCVPFGEACWTAQRQNPAHWEAKEKVGRKDWASSMDTWSSQSCRTLSSVGPCVWTLLFHHINLFVLCICVPM